MGSLSLLFVGFCFFNVESFLFVLAWLSGCGSTGLCFLLPCILWTQGKKEMHTYIWQRLCSENFQLNLLLAPFSFFLFVDAIYYSNVGRVEPSGALLSLIILWD